MNVPPPPPESIPADARNWAMGCHFMALSGLVVSGIGFVIGPLVVWLVKRESHPFVDDQGKEAVNFQITMLIAMLICIPLVFLVIGIFLLPALAIVDVVLTIIAGISASNGQWYRYPFTIRFLK